MNLDDLNLIRKDDIMEKKTCVICKKTINNKCYFFDIDPEKQNGDEVICPGCNKTVIENITNNKGENENE